MKKWKILLILSPLILYFTIVFRPLILNGRLPIPADLIVGMYHPWRDFLSSTYTNGVPFKNFLISDPVRQLYPWRELSISLLKSGAVPGWNPYSFSGYPLAANFQSAPFYPLNVLYLINNFSIVWSVQIILQLVLGFIFMFLFLRRIFKLSNLACIVGSVSWIGSGFFVAWLEWNSVVQTVIWLPLALLALSENKKILLIFSLVNIILAGHLQSAFYCWVVVGIWSLKSFNTFKTALLAFVISIIATFWWIFPAIQLILNSARSVDQSIWQKPDWFIPWQNTAQFLAPDYFGNPSTQNYFGIWNYAEFVGYISITSIWLALIGMFTNLKKQWLLVSIFVGACLLALPTPIGALPFRFNLPFISTAQPSRLIMLIDFCLVIFAALGMESVLKSVKQKPVWIAASIICLLLFLLWAVAYFTHQTVSLKNLILPSLFFVTAVGLVFFKKWGQILLVILIVLDLSLFAQKFMTFSKSDWLYPQTKITKFLQDEAKNEVFRIAAVDDRIMGQNFSMIYRLQSVSGYDPLYLLRYAELIAAYERKKPDIHSPFGFNRAISPQDYKSPIMNLLNAKYILSFYAIFSPQYDLVMEEGMTKLYRNKNVLPRVFLVESVIESSGKQDSINKMFDPNFDPAKQAVVEGDVLSETGGEANIVSYKENEVVIKTSSFGNSFLVLLDTYYPNWKVSVDGIPSQLYITDYAFRGVPISSGVHEIKFVYSYL